MRRQTSIAQLLYSYLYPSPSANDPNSFSAHLARNLVPEVRVEVATFYGDLNSAEARYPGLNYCHPPHRMRLGRFKHHRRLFDAFDSLGLTYNEIQDFCCWEGTKWARERYEKDEGVKVVDTTGDEIGPFIDRRERAEGAGHDGANDDGRRCSITRKTDISVIVEDADGPIASSSSSSSRPHFHPAITTTATSQDEDMSDGDGNDAEDEEQDDEEANDDDDNNNNSTAADDDGGLLFAALMRQAEQRHGHRFDAHTRQAVARATQSLVQQQRQSPIQPRRHTPHRPAHTRHNHSTDAYHAGRQQQQEARRQAQAQAQQRAQQQAEAIAAAAAAAEEHELEQRLLAAWNQGNALPPEIEQFLKEQTERGVNIDAADAALVHHYLASRRVSSGSSLAASSSPSSAAARQRNADLLQNGSAGAASGAGSAAVGSVGSRAPTASA